MYNVEYSLPHEPPPLIERSYDQLVAWCEYFDFEPSALVVNRSTRDDARAAWVGFKTVAGVSSLFSKSSSGVALLDFFLPDQTDQDNEGTRRYSQAELDAYEFDPTDTTHPNHPDYDPFQTLDPVRWKRFSRNIN